MNGTLQVSVLGLVLALLGIVLLLGAFRAVAWLLAAIPIRSGRRDALRRAGPVVVGLASVAYALVAVRVVFPGTTLASSFAGVAVVGIALGLSWFALRDLVAGMFWMIDDTCRTGDVVRFEGVSGRVTRLGLRVVEMETDQGERVLVPYTKLRGEALVVSRGELGERQHVFTVKIPADRPTGDVGRVATRMAMLCHGTSLSRRPRVRQVAEDQLEVTVFALWSESVADLEFRIRRALEAKRTGQKAQ